MSRDLNDAKSYSDLKTYLDIYGQIEGLSCWHNYGPADYSLYISQSPKIMVINSESVGYDDSKSTPADEYMKWIKDGWKTPHFTALFVTMIRKYCKEFRDTHVLPPYSKPTFSSQYKKCEELLESMKGTIYMNARITSNGTGSFREETQAVLQDSTRFADYRKKYMEILDPEIVICAGSSAHDAMFTKNSAFGEDVRPSRHSVSKIQNRIVISLNHFSRPQGFRGYQGLHDLATQCCYIYFNKL
ncbi:MAG: hypothetical protein RL095_854 [Verrucomicrobiota bacterium]|jgi:hypothetical protein